MRFGRRQQLAVLMVLFGALAVGGVAWVASTVPDEIEEGVTAALAGTGIAADVDGRDVTLFGAVDQDVERRVLGVDGVRTVRWDAAGDAAAPSSPATSAAPQTTSPPATEAPPSTATTTTTTAPATTTTTTPPTATTAPQAATFRAELVAGQLTLSGIVPSDEVREGIATVADLVYSPLISDGLQVDASAPSGPWLAGLPRAVAVLPIAGTAAFEIQGDVVVITGSTGTELKKATLEGALRQALGDSFSYDNRVEITGLAPPSFFADAPGDGSVQLTGSMPDQAIIDLIVAAAVDAFGAGNVDNQLTVEEGLENTFSNFRIPFIFAPLSQVPQWEVNISNDVITGGLRAGASFEFDSAELTPQLQQLATIAAGILARNPTITATIEGHTDSQGTAEYNQDLSERRANAARDFIIALGIAPDRLEAAGFGESAPIASNATEEGRAQNRRIEFRLGPLQGGS